MVKLTLIQPYYRLNAMVPLHQKAWTTHAPGLEYIVVDDGSPEPLDFFHPRMRLIRVDEDVPWNVTFARNLGAHLATSDWLILADFDHVVIKGALAQIQRLDFTDPNIVYMLQRWDLEHHHRGGEQYLALVINRNTFFKVGGYDEDFRGHYGGEDTFFGELLAANRVKVVKTEIELAWRPHLGFTPCVSRDLAPNQLLWNQKVEELRQHTYQHSSILRTPWHEVYERKNHVGDTVALGQPDSGVPGGVENPAVHA